MLSYSSKNPPECNISHLISTLPNLTELYLEGLCLDDEFIPYLAMISGSLKRLRLELSSQGDVINRLLDPQNDALPEFPNLEYFRLKWHKNDRPVSFHRFPQLPKLRLHLTSARFDQAPLNFRILDAIAQHCPQLISLNLTTFGTVLFIFHPALPFFFPHCLLRPDR